MNTDSVPKNKRDCYDLLETARDGLKGALAKLVTAQDDFDARYGHQGAPSATSQPDSDLEPTKTNHKRKL